MTLHVETLHCENDQRRDAVRKNPNFNGLDYLEVSSDQRTLTIYFLDKAPDLKKENIRITGGQRITDIRVIAIDICRSQDPERDDCLSVRVDKPGDFSCYKLCIVKLDEQGRPTKERHPDFDPRYWCLEFSFKANCPSDLDCAPLPCPVEVLPQLDINYLAKDYASFRQLILDRLALLVPDWQERHVPDLGIALVELLAYTGDHLSYYQDAVATEAYLDTARQRISVRRHARLVDYIVSEGCNARTWLHLHTDSDVVLEPNKLAFITSVREFLNEPRSVLNLEDLRNVPASEYVWFEPVAKDAIELYKFHNEIYFYTWGDSECCLAKGATSATLLDAYKQAPGETNNKQSDYKKDEAKKNRKQKQQTDEDCGDDSEEPTEPQRELKLKVGDVLILEEVLGPKTGNPADADSSHRQAVKLTKVTPGIDPLYHRPIVEIEWHKEDALPFALCISSTSQECVYLEHVSVARGNIILVDHGRTLNPEFLGEVPGKEVLECNECGDKKIYTANRFRPMLKNSPLTFSETIKANASATATVLGRHPRQALPAIKQLISSSVGFPEGTSNDAKAKEILDKGGLEWSPRYDLLASQGDDAHVVVEMDNDGYAHLRFGDNELGRQPEARYNFAARYRVGNGTSGNVGADSITHLISFGTLSGVSLEPRNPLPAIGGMKAETLVEAKLMAPYAFRSDVQRAITPSDYTVLAERDVEEVQRANARLRWTGSWYEMQVVVDAEGQSEAAEKLLEKVDHRLRRYRRIAHDLRVSTAQNVPLELSLLVCVNPHYQTGHVKRALLERFSNRALADSTKGFFHPDNLSFGEGMFVSRIIAEAKAITGVENIVITKLQRFGDTEADSERVLESGGLELDPFEIARLDNDPSFPENGVLKLEMRGGR
jgi:hypothetical protein